MYVPIKRSTESEEVCVSVLQGFEMQIAETVSSHCDTSVDLFVYNGRLQQACFRFSNPANPNGWGYSTI